jgi:putative resolvase
MKLSDWARANGISYKTAWLWWKRGKLQVPARQTPTGTILVDMPERKEAGAALDAGVSSADQKADLDRQVARLAAFAAERGLRVAKVVTEVGSGLNSHRKGLISALRSPEYGAILV